MSRSGSPRVWPVALALAACTNGGSPGPAASPPPELRELTTGGFHDTLDLLHSIETGSFARRAGLLDEVRAAKLPDPVTIAFVSGTEVPAAQRDALQRLAQELSRDRRIAVELVGCSDPSGSAQTNLRISQARAESVAARLRALGVEDAQITRVEGRGEKCEPQERVVRATPRYTSEASRVGAQPRGGERDGDA